MGWGMAVRTHSITEYHRGGALHVRPGRFAVRPTAHHLSQPHLGAMALSIPPHPSQPTPHPSSCHPPHLAPPLPPSRPSPSALPLPLPLHPRRADEAALKHGGVRLSATPNHYQAVLGLGSNASPIQLARKFGTSGHAIPVIQCVLQGWDVVYAAHVSFYAAATATLAPCPGASCEVALLLLDEDQTAAIDATEGGHELCCLEGVDLHVARWVHGCMDAWCVCMLAWGMLVTWAGGTHASCQPCGCNNPRLSPPLRSQSN